MILSCLYGLVLAEGITADQVKQLSAVMLGLVVFAAVFVLVERQRSTRHVEDPPPPRVEESTPSAPPRYLNDTEGADPHQAVHPTDPPFTRVPNEIQPGDQLPVPFVPRSHESAPPVAPPAAATEAPAAPESRSDEQEPSRADPAGAPEAQPPAGERPGGFPTPESPDEIGIILPDEG